MSLSLSLSLSVTAIFLTWSLTLEPPAGPFHDRVTERRASYICFHAAEENRREGGRAEGGFGSPRFRRWLTSVAADNESLPYLYPSRTSKAEKVANTQKFASFRREEDPGYRFLRMRLEYQKRYFRFSGEKGVSYRAPYGRGVSRLMAEQRVTLRDKPCGGGADQYPGQKRASSCKLWILVLLSFVLTLLVMGKTSLWIEREKEIRVGRIRVGFLLGWVIELFIFWTTELILLEWNFSKNFS